MLQLTELTQEHNGSLRKIMIILFLILLNKFSSFRGSEVDIFLIFIFSQCVRQEKNKLAITVTPVQHRAIRVLKEKLFY